MNILITCCLGDHIKSNVEDIRSAYPNCRIIGTDMRQMFFNRNGLDAFYNVSACSDDGYVDEIIEICKKEKASVVISFSSLDIVPFRSRKNDFDELGIKIALGLDPDNRTLQANDKLDFIRIASEYSLKVAETMDKCVNNKYELEDYMNKNGITKIVVKEVDSTGAKGMKVYDFDYLLAHDVSFDKPVIAQKFLSGTEYSVDCFCKHGKTMFSCVKVNYEMDLGVSIYSEVINRPDIAKICEDACRVFCLDGLVGFDLKEDENGEVFILECNPRPTATISLVARAGVNLLKHLIEYYVDGYTDFSNEVLDYGMKIVRYRNDYYFKEGETGWMQ